MGARCKTAVGNKAYVENACEDMQKKVLKKKCAENVDRHAPRLISQMVNGSMLHGQSRSKAYVDNA